MEEDYHKCCLLFTDFKQWQTAPSDFCENKPSQFTSMFQLAAHFCSSDT